MSDHLPSESGVDLDEATRSQPDWFKTAVFYEVLVRSFRDSNGDGTGDGRSETTSADATTWPGRMASAVASATSSTSSIDGTSSRSTSRRSGSTLVSTATRIRRPRQT
mgnify:CR=1 FL=1